MFGCKRVRRENEALRQALNWYANEDNYRRKGVHAPGEAVKLTKAPMSHDRGAMARVVLSQYGALRAETPPPSDAPPVRWNANKTDGE